MAYDPNAPIGASPGPGYIWDPISTQWRPGPGATPDPWAGNDAGKAAFEAARQASMGSFSDPSYTAGFASQGTNPGNVVGGNGGQRLNAPTIGSIASGVTPMTSNRPGQPGFAGGFPAPTTGTDMMKPQGAAPGGTSTGNPMDAFINPMADYMREWANKGLQSAYSATGNFQSGPAAQGISDYNRKMALGEAWQPAFADFMANQQQQHQFAQEDQTIPFTQNLELAKLGLGATSGAGSLAATLAALLSGNTTAIGQAQAGGAVGGSNAITTAISQFLSQMLSQNMMNRIPALNPTPGP